MKKPKPSNDLSIPDLEVPSIPPLELVTARNAVDNLFYSVQKYRTGQGYKKLVDFLATFPCYSHYNKEAIHLQMPTAEYVLSEAKWKEKYGLIPRYGARPMMIIQRGYPLMPVYDRCQVENPKGNGMVNPPLISDEMLNPFRAKGNATKQWEIIKRVLARDGIRLVEIEFGSEKAGDIASVESDETLIYCTKKCISKVKYRYLVGVNESLSETEKYLSLSHELGHLYCGHHGSLNGKYWSDRKNKSEAIKEFEAESVSYFIGKRLRIETEPPCGLIKYIEQDACIPDISLAEVLKAAELIELMSRTAPPPRV